MARNIDGAWQRPYGKDAGYHKITGNLIEMEYQLTLKFPYYDLNDYKSIIHFEEKLKKQLGNSAKIDGHYAESEIMNIFVITSQPLETFVLVLQVVKNEGLLSTLSILCRAVNGYTYARLWPLKLEESFEARE